MKPRKNAAAAGLGRRGGKATAANRTPQQRTRAARKAARARWNQGKVAAA